MTTRELPPDEWGRLTETDLAPFLSLMDPTRVKVFVVEDADGQIIGTWSLVQMWHAEGCWIHPSHRGGAVASHLLTALRAGAAEVRALTLMTAADRDGVRDFLSRLGAIPSDLTLFSWPMTTTLVSTTVEPPCPPLS